VYDKRVDDTPLTQEQLEAVIDAAPRLPMVTVWLEDGPVPAALLVWGRHDRGWVAGVSFLRATWHSRALVTTWVPADRVRPAGSGGYRLVPRVRLSGNPETWPSLPPRYPAAPPEWLSVHRHEPYRSPL